MRTTFLNQARWLTLIAVTATFLSGCGSGATTTSTATATTALTPAGTVVVAAPTLTLSLVLQGTTTSTTSVSSGAPATAKATLIDANGAVVPNAVVTFSTDATMGTISPTGGTALTDASGVASVVLNPASVTAAGASTITAIAQVGTAAVSGSIGYSIGASTVTMTAPVFGSGTGTAAAPALSSFGTTSATVIVCQGSGAATGGCVTGSPIAWPQVVTFSSSCAGSGKALLTASVTTVNGVATGSYRDSGCAGSDVVTASIGSLAAPTNNTLYVAAPIAGSIQYVSATPTMISLAGTGGQSTSQVVFKVVDGGGNPISGKAVVFGLSTTLGGLSLTPAVTAPPTPVTSDASGTVFTSVNAGTMSTPVRVTASTCTTSFATPLTTPPTCTGGGTLLSTQSNQLTVTTGIPAQSSFSLSATILNIEGWELDGTTTVLTARLADHFSNFPPDGTAINFIAEGARVVGSCVTVSGDCSATFNSQAIRPADGRVTVLAYAVGEESFIDTNGNGVADKVPGGTFGPELVTINGATTDIGEAYVDYNENGVFDPLTEPYVDFNGNGLYDGTTSGLAPYNYTGATSAGDSAYNGVLCNATSSAGTCSATKSIHVRGSIVIVLSGNTPTITTDVAAKTNFNPATFTLNLDPTVVSPATTGTGCGGPQIINLKIVDLHGNLMPAGSTVTFATVGDGTVVSSTGHFPVENANTPIASIPAYNYSVTIKGDGARDPTSGACTDSTFNGALNVTVTTPKGVATTQTIANLIN